MTNKLSLFKVFMSNEVSEQLKETLYSGFITQGPKVELFEKKLSEYIGNNYILTVNSATSGLILALRLLKNKIDCMEWPGFDTEIDYVLTPALTCFATTSSVLVNNYKIKWLDVDSNTSCVDLNDLEQKLNMNTKIVILVHWGGYPIDLDRVKYLQEQHYKKYNYRFQVIEDCAHSFGAEYKNIKLGNHNNMCVFSFQAIKHLTTGDGGALVCPNAYLYDNGKLLRWFGIDRDKRNYKNTDFRLENDIQEYGFKFHMNDINATIGLCNLKHIDEILIKNRNNYDYIYNNLSNNSNIRLLENKQDRKSSCWLFTMCVREKDKFIKLMDENNIMVSQVHNRNDKNTCVKQYICDLPNLDKFEKEMICIPVGWWLDKEDLDKIINIINSIN